jgi:hypothetical protein
MTGDQQWPPVLLSDGNKQRPMTAASAHRLLDVSGGQFSLCPLRLFAANISKILWVDFSTTLNR